MILSEINLRPLPDNQVYVCCGEGCNSPATFKDAHGSMAFCNEHTLLEDLDPGWSSNQRLLDRAPVSRMAAFTWLEKFSDLFSKREQNKDRGQRGLWVSMPTGTGLNGESADAKDALVDWIAGSLIYGAGGPLDKSYYVQVIRRGDLAYINLKYQQILGTRFLGIVEWASVVEFFGERKN